MADGTRTRLIAERYALGEPLGKGGMGVVWRSQDRVLKREVAVKEVEIPPSVPADERDALRGRVMREARAAARLSHPRAVQIYDVVEEEGHSFIVMELVEAPTLSQLVRSDGPLRPERVAAIGLQVLDALEKAHREGIVHRDVKPGNVMVTPEGHTKLADFGIASLKGDPKITTTGMILGSPSFMAPEQATGAEAGPATDIYSLGATLYYALEGSPPFDKGQAIPTLTAVINDEPTPPTHGGELGGVIVSILAKDAADRPAVPEVRARLEAFAVTGSGAASASSDADARAAPVPPPIRPRPATRPASGRRRSPMILAAALLLALVGAGIFLASRDEPRGTGANGANRERRRGDAKEEATPTTESSTDGETAVLAGATRFEIPGTGYTFDYPQDWTVEEQDSTRYDFRDPGTGTYLRLDWTDTPGPSAEQAWLDLEGSFSASHENYRRITIEDTDFQSFTNAALWEFTWSEAGADLHAYNLGFVTNDRSYGFALNFVAHEESWAAAQPVWASFLTSFHPGE